MWLFLGIVSIIFLIIFWHGKNAVWGGLTLGAVIGIVASLIPLIIGNEFDWLIIIKIIIIGTLLGVIA